MNSIGAPETNQASDTAQAPSTSTPDALPETDLSLTALPNNFDELTIAESANAPREETGTVVASNIKYTTAEPQPQQVEEEHRRIFTEPIFGVGGSLHADPLRTRPFVWRADMFNHTASRIYREDIDEETDAQPAQEIEQHPADDLDSALQAWDYAVRILDIQEQFSAPPAANPAFA